ncbi:MAG: DUF4251 domain-containing protein [Bacteroidales bacterium]|nr:DUF4251 domain-containing protein [Bacteroidales bacterium]
MKSIRLVAIVILSLVLASACGISRRSPQERQAEALRIQEMLDSRNYTIDINYMLPLRSGGKAVSTYSLKVTGDTLDSHLPFIGEARMVPYGGGKGLNFQERISSYDDSGPSSDRRAVTMEVKNEEDSYVYTLTVFDNGDADIHVHCGNRDDISYRGSLRIEDMKE